MRVCACAHAMNTGSEAQSQQLVFSPTCRPSHASQDLDEGLASTGSQYLVASINSDHSKHQHVQEGSGLCIDPEVIEASAG